MSQDVDDLRTRATPARLASFWRAGLTVREEHLFPLLAIVIGILSGLAVVCFRIAIDWARLLLLGSSLAPPVPRVVLVPAVVGLVVALLVKHLFPRVRGSGVNQTKAALFIYDGFIPFNTVTGKFVTCALAIGSGQSLGPEDPSLQIGAGIASALGRRLRLSRQKLRLIAPIGAAAGLGAAFNAPIAAVLFVIEEVIGGWSAGVLGAIVLASVSSVVVVRWFLGDAPMFVVPPYHLAHPQELVAYVALGCVGGLASLAFVKVIAYLRPRVRALPSWAAYSMPAVAGALVGLTGIWFPQVMGVGYNFIDQALHDQYGWQMLILLGGLKILATAASFSSGTPGGLFAPTLFIGAMIGGAVGGIAQHSPLVVGGSVGSFALVGMGTLFAGIIRAPMTSVFMVLEVSGSYSIILPVMISNAIAYVISRRFQRTPIFDVLTRQDGLELPSMEEQREERSWRVEDAMRVETGPVISLRESMGEVTRRIGPTDDEWFVVRTRTGFGAVAREAIERVHEQRADDAVLGDVMRIADLPHVHPDQSLELALRLLVHARRPGTERAGGSGEGQRPPLLPVLHRADATHLVGVIMLPDILEAYGGRTTG